MKYIYKTIAALGAISIIPLFIFVETIYFRIGSAALTAILGIGNLLGVEQLSGALEQTNGKIPAGIADTYSPYELYKFLSDMGGFDTAGKLEGKFDILIAPAITGGVVLALLVICAIVTAVFAIVAKDNRKVIYSSMAGIGLSLMFKECFEGFAAPILDGSISLATVADSFWAGLIANFEELILNTNFWFIPLAFGAIILWTVLYNYTLPEKEKKARKIMLGEADDE